MPQSGAMSGGDGADCLGEGAEGTVEARVGSSSTQGSAKPPMPFACALHPEIGASALCEVCHRPVCDECVVHAGRYTRRCPRCERRHRIWARIAVGAGALALIGVVAARPWRMFRATGSAVAAPEASAGQPSPALAQLLGALAREPCDRRKIIELAELLYRQGDARGAVSRADAFMAKCGDLPRLRWVTYAAYKQLSEWDRAAGEASKLIDSDPYDADYRGWRGLVYEQTGDFGRAAEDYKQALVLRPQLSDLPLNLAKVYEKLGRRCDSIEPLLQLVFYNSRATNIGAVEARIDALTTSEECSLIAGRGNAQLRLSSDQPVMTAPVRINGRFAGNFIVDTGATLVVLSRATAERLGVDLNRAPSLLAQTANGVGRGSAIMLDRVEVQGARTERVTAVAVDGLGKLDGLLGMSFLSRFDLHRSRNVLELSPRHTGASPSSTH